MRDPSRDNPTEAEIQDLITQRKFREAFHKAYLSYWQGLVTYNIKRLVGHGSNPQADGEELAQETFGIFWKKLHIPPPIGYNPSRSIVRTYLFAIARNLVKDKVKLDNVTLG
jgi:DNA-directed RNA polymerase specialized sigma24 family protein